MLHIFFYINLWEFEYSRTIILVLLVLSSRYKMCAYAHRYIGKQYYTIYNFMVVDFVSQWQFTN